MVKTLPEVLISQVRPVDVLDQGTLRWNVYAAVMMGILGIGIPLFLFPEHWVTILSTVGIGVLISELAFLYSVLQAFRSRGNRLYVQGEHHLLFVNAGRRYNVSIESARFREGTTKDDRSLSFVQDTPCILLETSELGMSQPFAVALLDRPVEVELEPSGATANVAAGVVTVLALQSDLTLIGHVVASVIVLGKLLGDMWAMKQEQFRERHYDEYLANGFSNYVRREWDKFLVLGSMLFIGVPKDPWQFIPTLVLVVTNVTLYNYVRTEVATYREEILALIDERKRRSNTLFRDLLAERCRSPLNRISDLNFSAISTSTEGSHKGLRGLGGCRSGAG